MEPATARQKTAHQAAGGVAGGEIVDAREMIAIGPRQVRDKRDDRHAELLETMKGLMNGGRIHSHHGDAGGRITRQRVERGGHRSSIEARHLDDPDLRAFGAGTRNRLFDLGLDLGHEGIVADRQHEDERIGTSLGEIGGRHIADEADPPDRLLDASPGARADAGPPVEHPIDRGKAHPRRFGNVMDCRPHVSSGRHSYSRF